MHDLIERQAAIDALCELPSAQPEPCGDVVSRNAIIQKLNTMDRYVSEELRLCDTDKKFPQNEVFIVDDVYEEIVENLPSAQPKSANELAEKAQNAPNNDFISRKAAIDALMPIYKSASLRNRNVFSTARKCMSAIEELPSAQPEWNNHTVACMLAELFDDTCACNYNGIDEWLPSKCELLDSCPNPVGVACWEQYLTHRAERRTDEAR